MVAQINYKNSEGNTPLHCAALNKENDMLALLNKNGGDCTLLNN
jgi:ankyrin repeat protein